MRPLTILSVAYPLAPVGPDAVGGSEQILTALDGALTGRGHRSIVVAMEGSVTAGTLLPYPAPPPGRAIDADIHAERQRWTREIIEGAVAREPIDLIHAHGLDYHHYLPAPGPPMLATLHLPVDWYPPEGLAPPRPDTWVHGVSATQASRFPPSAQVLPPIANGVPLDQLDAPRQRRCIYALVLSRICPEKGVHLALEAAHAADVPLLIAGEIFPYPAHQAYFHDRVRPLLDRRRRFLGPVGRAQKRRLLAGARCLLVPSLVAETSSLVAMEAAAAGAPVIAFHSGALPEVVEHGRTGLLVDNARQMAAAIAAVDAIDSETCRATARTRFDRRRMVDAYLERYQSIARPARAAA